MRIDLVMLLEEFCAALLDGYVDVRNSTKAERAEYERLMSDIGGEG